MLYANSSAGYSELAKALAAFGADSEAIAAFSAFMQGDRAGDISLIKDVKRIDLHGSIDYKRIDMLEKAIKKELIRPNDTEGLYRYIVFVYYLGGALCWRLLEGYRYPARENDKIYSDMNNAFEKYFDEQHKPYISAAVYGVKMTEKILYSRGSLPEKKDAKTCLDAASTLERDIYAARFLLITYALDSLNKGDTELLPKALGMLDEILKTLPETLTDRAKSYLLLVLAQAGHFDEKYVRTLISYASKFDKKFTALQLAGTPNGVGKIQSGRVYEVIDAHKELVTPQYIIYIGSNKHLEALAKTHTDTFTEAVALCEDPVHAAKLEKILIESGAEYDAGRIDIKESTAKNVINEFCMQYDKSDRIRAFLEGSGSLDEAKAQLSTGKLKYNNTRHECAYYKAFGRDGFSSRAVTLAMLAQTDYGRNYRIEEYTGFDITDDKNVKPAYEMMTESGCLPAEALDMIAKCIDDSYQKEKLIAAAIAQLDEVHTVIKDMDTKPLSATARVIYTIVAGKHSNSYKDKLLALTDDGSKAVKAELVKIIAGHKDWADDIKALLKAKKASKRELAADIIAVQGAAGYTQELSAAFEAEKSEKLKIRLGALIGAKGESKEQEVLSFDKTVEKLAKSAKKSKYSFLFDKPFKPVHMTDGTQASEDILTALVMCYTSFTAPARSDTADELAKSLVKGELEGYAAEVFGRWLDNGAQAKQKCILYFCAVHGGQPMVREFMHYIKEWGENMRGAIASEAVRAMALDGSSEALMNIDNMSRKFKNKQVRAAAADALANAAEQLGITTQELADKIVPDLGFDENLCRVFDFGARKFNVYITPALELEIFSGEKQIKNLPKAGANDNKEKAEKAISDFREMKKLLKATVTAQKQRLEYVMMCDRKWTSQSWKELFVNNAVMHCFAIGLIWGVYDDGKLTATFRYMDDGSFTTADEEEFTLPENAQIGLVHPIELTADEIKVWVEQLSDYEITQPFNQLGRKVYLIKDSERELKRIGRFKDKTLNSITLVNKMTKLGWYKGYAEDAGFFYYFYRDDFTARNKNENGGYTNEGFGAMLTFSGASVVIYDFDGEDTEAGDIIFYKAGEQPNYYDKEEKGCLKAGEVSPRYFSEIIMQLCTVFGEEKE